MEFFKIMNGIKFKKLDFYLLLLINKFSHILQKSNIYNITIIFKKSNNEK